MASDKRPSAGTPVTVTLPGELHAAEGVVGHSMRISSNRPAMVEVHILRPPAAAARFPEGILISAAALVASGPPDAGRVPAGSGQAGSRPSADPESDAEWQAFQREYRTPRIAESVKKVFDADPQARAAQQLQWRQANAGVKERSKLACLHGAPPPVKTVTVQLGEFLDADVPYDEIGAYIRPTSPSPGTPSAKSFSPSQPTPRSSQR